MAHIKSFEIYTVDLPFKKPFKHAAAARTTSESIFIKCFTDTFSIGFGECLPRKYVTGESRDSAYYLLRTVILPKLIGEEFKSFDDVKAFLNKCDGKAPAEWNVQNEPQSAAWCAVDLALLDTFGREFQESLCASEGRTLPSDVRYSVVMSADNKKSLLKTALKLRLFGIRQVKLKVDKEVSTDAVKMVRTLLGRNVDLRVDANMAWNKDEAPKIMKDMSAYGVSSFEQPLPADDIAGLAQVVKETGLGVMVDESLNDRASLSNLIAQKACTAVNVRISKCGGLIAALNRCQEAGAAGLDIQVGCQVGESSLLSAAHLALLSQVPKVKYAEGCFGLLLLREDPTKPVLQFGRGGRAPKFPKGYGLGVNIQEDVLSKYTTKSTVIK